MKDNKDNKSTLLIPPKAGVGIAIVAVMVAMLTYMFVIPFDFVFTSGGTEVYRQEAVGVLNNIEKNALDDEGSYGWEKVYGEKALRYVAEDGEEVVHFDKNYGAVKKLMMRTALKNLFTFSWDREDFTIEFCSK